LIGALVLAVLIAVGESAFFQAWPPALRVLVNVPRLLLGLAYVLFVPGYAATAALFPETEDRDAEDAGGLDGIERTGLSLGLGVAWVSILALILDRLPWGLRLWPIFIGEIASILLLMAVALWRRGRLPHARAYVPPLDWRPRPWWRSLSTFEQRIYRLCIGALLVAGLAAAWVFLVPSPDEFMTEFYILGAEGLAESYPRAAVPGETLTVTMGIHNLERGAHTYRVEVWAVDIWEDRGQTVATSGPFALDREASVEQPLSWSMPWAGQDQQVEFRLYSDAQNGPGEAAPDPYRLLRLWLSVDEP
jgi:uncharacterized membrane protein